MRRLARTLVFAVISVILQGSALVYADTMSLAWDPNTEPNIAGYRLSYGSVPGSHPVTVDVGNRTNWTIRGLTDGQRYYFVVAAYTNTGQVSPPSAEASGVAVGLVSLLSNVSSSAPTGAALTWTAIGGSMAPLEYQFFRYSQAGGAWSSVQGYSANNTFTWTPAASEVGTYAVMAWARTPGSTQQYEAWRSSGTFTLSNGPVEIGSIEADVALPASTGTTITWKVKGSGGPAPLQYRFHRFSEATGTWTMLRDYTTSDTYSWTPAAGELGRYRWSVWVRGAGSAAAYDAWRASEYFEIKNGPPAVATVATTTTFPAGTGTSITWKAVAAGGPGPLEYRFYRFSQATGAWTMVQDYSASSSYTWTPGSTNEGSHVVMVWVRRQGSTSPNETTGTTGFFQISNAPLTAHSVSFDTGPPIATGVSVNIRANASGGPGPLQYAFYLYNDSKDTWAKLRDYSTSNTMTWTPTQSDIGNFAILAWIRRAGSTAANDTSASSGMFSVEAGIPVVRSVTSNVASSVTVGTPMTWSASATGGPGPLEFRFWMFNEARQAWTMVQDYSWDNTLDWIPLAGEQGNYRLSVWVRRHGSTAAYEGFGVSSFFTVQ